MPTGAPVKKTTKRGRGEGGQKSTILRRHSLWTAPKSNEIDPCINVNAKQIEAIVKQGLGSETTKEFTAQRTQ